MEKKGWKTLAIIFIVLFTLETMTLIYLYNLGQEIAEQEMDCVFNVCSDSETYYYDMYEETCFCYNSNDTLDNIKVYN